jgi:molybdenum cofactor cytidylyltransferase
MNAPRTFALVPAAGKSQRMGQPKLLLPLAGRSVLQRVVDVCREADLETILVVVAPKSPELARQAEDAGAAVLQLGKETPDMRATVLEGLAWLESSCRPAAQDSWLLVPADHPMVNSRVVRELLTARAGHANQSIFLPTFNGRRGHPTLIAWHHVSGIRQMPPGTGLNAYLREQPAKTCLVPVDTDEVLLDLDTPDDYLRMLERVW